MRCPPDGALPERGHPARSTLASQQCAGFIDSSSNSKPAAAWKAALRLIAALLRRETPALRIGLRFLLVLLPLSTTRLLAAEKAFTLGGVNLTLEDVSSDVEVRYRSMRLNRAQNVWNVEALLTNKSSRIVQGPFVLLVDSFTGTTGPQQADGSDDSTPAKAFYDFSAGVADGALSPGELTPERTLTMGVGTGAPNLGTKIFAAPNRGGVALGLVRSLNEVGQPLTGVQIEEIGPIGPTNFTTDPVFAVATVGQGGGPHVWKFSAPGYLPVWRQQSLSTGEVAVILSPRLTRRGTNTATITLLDGAQVRDASGAVQTSFAAGAVTQNATATLTPLTGQTLPVLLPRGWSPLQAFWLELSGPISTPATASLKPSGPIGTGETAAFVRLNENTLQWEVAQLLAGNGTNALTATLNGSGAYALVVGDAPPQAPPFAQTGQPLLPSAVALPDLTSLTASGTVDPSSSPASRVPELVTGTASVTVSHPSNALPSGLVLRGEVIENYRLNDGTGRHPPQYENFVIGYQRPGDASASTLHASFPLRPLFLFGSEELEEATVKVDLLTPTPFAGSVLDARGGQVSAEEVRVLAGSGDMVGQQAAQLRRLNPTNFLDLVPTNIPVVAAFDVTVSGVAAGRRLIAQITGAPTNSLLVLARVLYDQGQYGLQPLERLSTDSIGRLATAEPVSGDRLDGIVGAGQYVLVQANSAQALVNGIARNSAGQPTAGMPVRITGQPWLAFSKTDGSFELLAPTGNVNVAVTDPATGDTGQSTLVVTDPNATANTSLASAATGPHVISINPSNGAVNVSRVTPIEIAFSEPINPGSPGPNGIQLLGTNGQPVAASVTLNLRNTTITLLPTEQLAPSALHTVRLSTNIADPTGLKLEGLTAFTFTTESDLLNRGRAELVIFAPGSTNIPALVLASIPAFTPGEEKDAVVVEGKPGSAEPGRPVILINESTGETSTVLSKVDGSFYGLIRGGEDDFVSATIMNANDTRTYLPVSRQKFDNGFVGLYQSGGILEAESDGGPVQVLVEPGAIPNKTKFRLESFGLTELLALLQNTPPTNATLVGRGLQLSVEGDALTSPLDISIPISPAELEQAGVTNGLAPENALFALVSPATMDGDPVYILLDKMEFEDGKLVTRSPPFPGADSLITPADRVSEAMRAVSLQRSLPRAGGADASVRALAIAPIILSERSQPLIFRGKVFEIVANEAGNEVAGIRSLAGAVVTVNAVGSFSRSRPGRLLRGSICCVSGANGSYAMMVPQPEIGDPLNPAGSPEEFVLMAAHPSRLEQVTQLANPTVSVARLTDIIFPPAPRGPSTDGSPPRISVFHTPTFPAPGVTAQFVVLATHGSGQPAVELEAVSSDLPSLNVQNDVQVSLLVREVIGPTAVRSTFNVTCPTNAVVIFKASAEVGSAPRSEVPYAVAFRGSGFPVQNPLPSNVQDISGPQVVRSAPRGDLGQSAPALAPGEPIIIEFSEPISRSVLQNAGAVQLEPAAGDLIKELSADQRVLIIRAYALQQDTAYTLTLNSQITDIVSEDNRLDQIQVTDEPDPFILRFRTAPIRTGTLTDVQSGGGVVLRGIYAYVLERAGPLDGAVVVYDLSDPQAPLKVAEIPIAGFPRDLALIPKYSFTRKTNPGAPVETKDLLAVVGGKVGGGVDEFGNLLQGFQYLRIFDIDDPDDPVRLAGAVVTSSPSAAVTKVQWSPPFLAYLESDADSQSISLVNLQSFILSSFIAPDEFSLTNNPGRDANGDGDFVDVDDELPIPSITRFTFGGKVAAFGLEGNTQRILDFDWSSADGFLGVTVSAGKLLDVAGDPIANLPPGYLTLLKRFIRPDRADAFVPIPDSNPKRVSVVFGVKFVDSSGRPRIADFALVSVDPNVGPSRIDVIEVTDPSEPELVRSINVPNRHGIVQSVRQRDDGLLMVATTEDMLLLDPSKLTDPFPQGGTSHPSFVGFISGLGTGARSFGGDTFGYHVVSLGGKSILKQTAPRISFVSLAGPISPDFPTAIHPDDIRDDPEIVALALSQIQRVEGLPPARFRADPDCDIASTLSPPDQSTHYYVLVEAPGSAGDTIELALETLNERGYPRRNKGAGFPPVRAMSSAALGAINQPARLVDAPINALTAYRMSTNLADPLYNVYLSKPFALVCEPMTRSEIAELQDELDREILWSGHYVRATLDFSLSELSGDNPVLSPFAPVPDDVEKVMRPGAVAVAEALPADYFFGPNPSAIIGHASLPGTFGSVAAHNGEFRTETVDFSLPSRRMGILFKRVIAGQDLYDGPFGRGWDFNYNQRFVPLSPDTFPGDAKCVLVACDDSRTGRTGDLLFYNGAGNVLVYKFSGTNPPPEFASDPLAQGLGWLSSKAMSYFHSPTGAFDMVVQFTDQRYGRLLPDGTQFWYSPLGRLESIHHRYTNNHHTLQYNDRGDLVRIRDHSVDTERYLDIGYYRDESEQAALSPLDTTTINVGEIGKIYRLVDYTGGGPGAGRDVRFEYSERGELTVRRGIEVTTAHQDGFTGRQLTRYEYNKGSTGPPQFPMANDITGITAGDPGGASLVSISDYAAAAPVPVARKIQGAQGLVELNVLYDNTAADLAAGNGRISMTNPDGSGTGMDLSKFGFPEKTEFSGNGAGSAAYRTFHNELGLPTEQHYPRGNKVVYTYQITQNLRSKPNITLIQRFSAEDEPVLDAAMAYDPKYNFQSGIQIDLNGNALTYTPTDDGLDIGQIDYPAVNVQLPPGVVSPVPLGLGARETFEYNDYGQLERQVDVNGVVRTWLFDRPDGFVSAEIRGEANSPLRTEITYSGLSGQLGLVHRSAPARLGSEPTEFTYDEREQLITSERGDIVSRFSYDDTGRQVRQSSTVDSGKELVETQEYLHNGFPQAKRLLQVETGTQQSLQSLVVSNTPDAMFRLTKVTYPGGEFREYKDLDHLGRPRRMTLGEYEEFYGYDENNNLLSVTRGTNAPAVTEYVYDGHDRLETERRPTGGPLKEETVRSYFDGGQLKEITVKAPGGAVLHHAKFHIDALGRTVASVTDSDSGPVVELYSFDGNTRVRRAVSANGEVSSIRYSNAGRPVEATNSIRSVIYTHDENDNLERTESREGPAGRNHFQTEHIPFDSLDRSQQLADNEGRVSSFAYRLDGMVSRSIDGRDNTNFFGYTRLREPVLRRLPSGVEFRHAYDRNRQTTLEGDREDLGWSYTYDSSLRSKTHSLRDTNTYIFSDFDERNLPRSIGFPGMNVVLNYDLQGRLLSRNSTYLSRTRNETNAYDALDRITSATFNGGSVSNRYDLLGPLREMKLQTGNNTYVLQYDIRQDSVRTNITYSSAPISGGRIAEQRDVAGRLLSVQPDSTDSVVSATAYEAADLIGFQAFGPDLIHCENQFDGRKRLVQRKYTRRSDGKVLAAIRYSFDANNNVVARQSLHRGGRVDFFHYDLDDRLIRADTGARPAISNVAPRQVAGFAVPPEVAPTNAVWSPGFFARTYAYDGQMLDRLTIATAINPDSLSLPAFAATIGSFDSALHAGTVDGFTRSRDSMGNTTNTVLHVRVPGSTAPVAVSASLQYDGKGQLVRVARDDGVTIEYEYLHSGLCYSRKVTGPANICVPSERIFVWDGARLLEEYDVTSSAKTLRARYFYTDSDVPVAADITDGGGALRRVYFLMDIQGSILATVNGAGEIIERYSYDAWGQPEIEASDTQAPVVRRIVSAPDGLLIEFSERVLPALIQPSGSTNRELAASFTDLASRLVIEQAGAPVAGTLIYEESRSGFAFGTVVRFQSAVALSGNLTLRVQSGVVNDEWNNPIAEQSIDFTFDPTPGTPLFSNLVSTTSTLSGRTTLDQPFLFHGQYFDFEAGLVYMRARFYDPFIGVFLQPDPAGYSDSVNPYAGFANNPQSLRDPSGNLVFVPVLAAVGAVIGGVIAGALEYSEQGEFNRDVIIAAAGGAVGGAFAGFTAGGSLLVEGAILGAIGGITGGATEAYFRGEQYSGEIAVKNALTGVAGGFAGAVGGRAVGAVIKSVKGSLRSLPGGVIDAVNVRGRAAPAAAQVPDAVQTASTRPTTALPAPRATPAEALERTDIIHRDALALERVSKRLRQDTFDFLRESRGFVKMERVDQLRNSRGQRVEGRMIGAKEIDKRHLSRPEVKFSMASGRMEGANTIAHEAFHARVHLGEVRNPFGLHSSGNPRAAIWEEAMANKHGFAWEMQMHRGPAEQFTPDLQNFLRGGDEWLVRTLARRYRVPLADALSVLGHLTP